MPLEIPEYMRDGVFAFADFIFDSRKLELSGKEGALPLDGTTRHLLFVLLRAGGNVVTRDEFLDEVWTGKVVADSSLSVAMGRLRKVFGPQAKKIIVTLSKQGYRLGVPVTFTPEEINTFSFGFREGETLIRRPGSRLVELLGRGGFGEAWLVEREGNISVFKFASGGQGLRALKREYAAYKLLSMGGEQGRVRVLSTDFENEPYFVETAYIGPSLISWANESDTLAKMERDQRVAFVAGICADVLMAHQLGIFHNDLKPGNVLVDQSGSALRPVVIDYGNSVLSDISLLGTLTLTAGQTADHGIAGGTALYMAPELRDGGPASSVSDVYSLGMLLYQVVVGDLSRPLASGWESEIDDEVLASDIRDATQGSPEKRIQTVDALFQRLTALPSRREALEFEREAKFRTAFLEEQQLKMQARKPWLIGSMVALGVGAIVSFTLYLRANNAQIAAEQNLAVANSLNAFLVEGVFASANPEKGGDPQILLKDAVDQGRKYLANIGEVAPAIEQQIHFNLGQLYLEIGRYEKAASEFEFAARQERSARHSLERSSVLIAQAWAALAHAFAGNKERVKELLAGLGRSQSSVTASAELAFLETMGRVQVKHLETNWGAVLNEAADVMHSYEAVMDQLPSGIRRHVYSAVFNADVKTEQLDDAAAVLDRWDRQRQQDSRSNDYEMAIIEKQRGRLLSRSGKLQEAIPVLERSYEAFVSALGKENVETINTLHSLAVARLESGQADEAVLNMTTVVERQKRELGLEHPFTLQAYSDMAAAMVVAGKTDDVIRMIAPILPQMIEAQGADHFSNILLMYNVVEAYIDTRNLEQARQWFTRCKVSGDRAFPPGSQWAGRIAFLEGSLENANGNFSEANGLLLRAKQEFDQHPEVDAAAREKLQGILDALREKGIVS